MKKIDFEKLAQLTNIEVEPEMFSEITKSVQSILNWEEELKSVDTSAVEPLFSVFDIYSKGLENLREDQVTEGSVRPQILQNSADKNDMFICVPKVIEQ